MLNVEKWYIKMSAMYAAGVWLMIGSYIYLGSPERSVIPAKTEEEEKVPDHLNAVYVNTAHSRSVIYYRKDYVPLKTRIQNFFSRNSGGGAGDE